MSSLEWQSHSKVEGKVAVEVVVEDGVVVAASVRRVDGFHTGIEADDEEVGIHAETDTVAHGDLFPEPAKLEFALRLILVGTDGPDVTRIDKGGATEFPEELGTVFEAQVQFEVARLVEEVDALVLSVVGTRTEGTHRPSSHAVGTTGEVALLEGELVGVAVGIGDAHGSVKGHRVVLVDAEALGEVEVATDILGKGDVAEGVLVVVVLLAIHHVVGEAEDVARGLDVESDGVGILAVGLFPCSQGIVGVGIAHFGDEQVLVVVLQDGIGLAE